MTVQKWIFLNAIAGSSEPLNLSLLVDFLEKPKTNFFPISGKTFWYKNIGNTVIVQKRTKMPYLVADNSPRSFDISTYYVRGGDAFFRTLRISI